MNQEILRWTLLGKKHHRLWNLDCSFDPMQVYTLCFERIIQLCVEKNDPCQEQGGWQIETVHWNRALWLRMRWDEVWQSAVPVNDTNRQTGDADGKKVRIVRVMHSLRLLSLVSHTVAPMHSLTTLSRRKTSSSCSEEEGERKTGLAASTASAPSGGADTWHGLQVLMEWMYVTKRRK